MGCQASRDSAAASNLEVTDIVTSGNTPIISK
jgi:hypothetical protein